MGIMRMKGPNYQVIETDIHLNSTIEVGVRQAISRPRRPALNKQFPGRTKVHSRPATTDQLVTCNAESRTAQC
jgi:hypothetical protein